MASHYRHRADEGVDVGTDGETRVTDDDKVGDDKVGDDKVGDDKVGDDKFTGKIHKATVELK